jgi:DNA-binding transcriptional LysR family regulator
MAAYTLRQLRYFVAAVENGSVAEASRQLQIAQPSISAAIKDLEDAFNMQLFIRHHAQGMSLTPAGTRFFRQAKDLLGLAYAFEQNALADNEFVSGQVDLGCFETVAPLHLPRLLSTFAQRYPGIKVCVHDGEQHDLLDGLGSGRHDLAMLFRHGLAPDLATESLTGVQQPHALLPAGHELAAQPAVSLVDLARMPMVLLDVPPSREYFLQVFEERGLHPQVACSSPSMEMVRGMVGQGFGFSLLVTRPRASRSYDGQVLAIRPLVETVTGSELVMAWRQRTSLTMPARLFLEHCKAVMQEPDGEEAACTIVYPAPAGA